MSELGRPLICDFGVSRMITLTQSLNGKDSHGRNTSVKGTIRWMSPELLHPPNEQDPFHTESSDIWAFAMTVYVRILTIFVQKSIED